MRNKLQSLDAKKKLFFNFLGALDPIPTLYHSLRATDRQMCMTVHTHNTQIHTETHTSVCTHGCECVCVCAYTHTYACMDTHATKYTNADVHTLLPVLPKGRRHSCEAIKPNKRGGR